MVRQIQFRTASLARNPLFWTYVLLATGGLLLLVRWAVGGSDWILPLELAILAAAAVLFTLAIWPRLFRQGRDAERRRAKAGPERVRLTVVPNEFEADLLCGRLRSEGIKCAHRVTEYAAGFAGGMPMMAGPREILVRETDLRSARDIVKRIER